MADGHRKLRRNQRGASRSQPRRRLPLWVIGQSLLALFLIGVVIWGVERLSDPQTLPLRKVNIEGQFKHVTKQKLSEAVAPYVTGGFFTIDLEAIQAAAEKLPWIARTEVRRIWPDSLQIQVEEQVPLARWGESALVSIKGEIFAPPRESFPNGLPQLKGPSGSEHLLVSRFKEIQAQLSPLELQVAQLTMGERRDWHIIFKDGMELVLGRAHNKQRLTRFRRVYTRLLRLHQEDIRRVDMRYTNGFVVAWREGTAPAWVREAALNV